MFRIFILVAILLASSSCFSSAREIQDTTDGIHWLMVFDTPILEDWLNGKNIASHPEYSYHWGSSEALVPMYRETNPNMILSKYIPWARDPDMRTLEWWKANHPDWILYNCDGVTPAGLSTDKHISLDISNPDVIDWQIENYAIPAMNWGYDHIAADNYALGNAVGGCGFYKNGVWTQRYIGKWWDAVYTSDSLNWLKTFRNKLHALPKPMKLGVNFVIMGQDINSEYIVAVTENVDVVVDEAGFTNWGEGKPDEARWLNIQAYIEQLQSKGKAYYGINQFAVCDTADKNYAIASYLMSNNGLSGLMVNVIQGYGRETYLANFANLKTGSPVGNMYKAQGVYWRLFTNGLAVVNAAQTSTTVTLAGDSTYVDVDGKLYKPGDKITFPMLSGLVLGLKEGPPAPPATSATSKTSTQSSATASTGATGVSTGTATSGTATSGTGTSDPIPPPPHTIGICCVGGTGDDTDSTGSGHIGDDTSTGGGLPVVSGSSSGVALNDTAPVGASSASTTHYSLSLSLALVFVVLLVQHL